MVDIGAHMAPEKVKNDTDLSGKAFATTLLKWNREKNSRAMPWKGEKDPYKIWLSEIILQQTRVEQGLKYYESFVREFPDIKKLAKATNEKVFKLWEGLGYYSRCRNLLETARTIATERDGRFPTTFEEIVSLKGVGPYTASAISSFAFNLPHAVVDGNVFRVLSRVKGIDLPIDSAEGKKYFTAIANEFLDRSQPGIYNQAIMDFGAVICKPVAPHCSSCVFNRSCYAFLNDKVNELPVKEKKISIRKRWFNYLIIRHGDQTAIRQRMEKDIWQQLYEFPLIETKAEYDAKDIMSIAEKQGWLAKNGYQVLAASSIQKQQLSHQLISGRFIVISLKKRSPGYSQWLWVKENDFNEYAFPKFINQYLHRQGGK